MASRKPDQGSYTVSGPGIDRSYPDFGPAFSAAITFAERAAEDAAFYVRDALGHAVGCVEKVNRQTHAHDRRNTVGAVA